MKEYSSLYPDLVEKSIVNGIKIVSLHIKPVFDGDMYAYDTIQMENSKFDYAGVVDALVQYKYPIDKMQAVINNYLLDPNDAYAIDEFNKMQAWRKEAKEIAKEALLYELS